MQNARSPSAQRENRAQQPSAAQAQPRGSTNTEWQSDRASQAACVVTSPQVTPLPPLPPAPPRPPAPDPPPSPAAPPRPPAPPPSPPRPPCALPALPPTPPRPPTPALPPTPPRPPTPAAPPRPPAPPVPHCGPKHVHRDDSTVPAGHVHCPAAQIAGSAASPQGGPTKQTSPALPAHPPPSAELPAPPPSTAPVAPPLPVPAPVGCKLSFCEHPTTAPSTTAIAWVTSARRITCLCCHGPRPARRGNNVRPLCSRRWQNAPSP